MEKELWIRVNSTLNDEMFRPAFRYVFLEKQKVHAFKERNVRVIFSNQSVTILIRKKVVKERKKTKLQYTYLSIKNSLIFTFSSLPHTYENNDIL